MIIRSFQIIWGVSPHLIKPYLTIEQPNGCEQSPMQLLFTVYTNDWVIYIYISSLDLGSPKDGALNLNNIVIISVCEI